MYDYHDRTLALELAEHAWLIAQGWEWEAEDGEFYWVPPISHTGSRTTYPTRGHAINSAKKADHGPTKNPPKHVYWRQGRGLAAYIVNFLQTRNGGELYEAFDRMRLHDRTLMLQELSHIFAHGGHPPNWVR